MFPRATVYEYTVLGVAQEIREGRWRAGIQRKGDAAIRRWRLSESQDPRRRVVLHVITGFNPGGRFTKHGVRTGTVSAVHRIPDGRTATVREECAAAHS